MLAHPKLLVSLLTCLLCTGALRAGPTVSFRNEVMAVLSKAGCNMGTCHGNQNGKNGFKLSLRGQDPAFDLASLTRDTLARRTNPHQPAQSLLLLKATGQAPHEGGKRFAVDSPEYQILSRWIEGGLRDDAGSVPRLTGLSVSPSTKVLLAPADSVKLEVSARFSDGSTRDVTGLACFDLSGPIAVEPGGVVRRSPDAHPGVVEGVVLVRYLHRQAPAQLAFVPERAGFTWKPVPENNYVDRHVFAKLKMLRTQPAELCSDSEFLRRAYLDTIGLLPTPEETRAFLADTQADKRAKLIDTLLARPEFADFWALKWADLLRVEEKTLDFKGVQAFHHWLRDSIAAGKPLNELARAVLSAQGNTYAHPPAGFYRALRQPDVRAETAAQVFLGVRLQCAKCHNHPFDRWTQDDYHGLTAFFARIQYRVLSNNRADRLDTHEFDGEQVVYQDRDSEWLHPRDGEAVAPKFLLEDKGQAPRGDRLELFADWVAEPKNPLFARAQANRIWFHLMGRGIVEPNDDFRASNPPVNGPLLDELARDLRAHRFDLRHLVRTIMQSRTYQLSSIPNESNREDESNFSHAQVRPLQAEQVLDAISSVTGVSVKFNGYPLGTRATQLPGVGSVSRRGPDATPGEKFLKLFGKPDRQLSCECARGSDTTLGQAFQLISGELPNELLREPDNRIGQLLRARQTNAQLVAEFYAAALSRLPSEREAKAAVAYLDRARDRRAALEDLVWGLLNSKEFLLRR
ncbi:MAG: DUF1549 and DUF1553 domain-containing protein [Gemmataceae bacterium]